MLSPQMPFLLVVVVIALIVWNKGVGSCQLAVAMKKPKGL
jgi:hypothetical protein